MSDAQSPFDGLRPPSPPEELRERVLGASRSAALEETPALVDRIWESRRARLAVAGLFAVLLAINFLIPPLTDSRARRPVRQVEAGAPEIEGIPLPGHRETVAEQLKELRRVLLVDGREREEL
jgi:hypothetical protein